MLAILDIVITEIHFTVQTKTNLYEITCTMHATRFYDACTILQLQAISYKAIFVFTV